MTKPSDQDLDISVAVVLRIGIVLSASVVILGGVLLHSHLFSVVPDYAHFQPGDPGLRSVMGIVQGAVNFTPKSVIQLGLLLLIATPVARVLLCVIGFTRQRNLLYVGVSSLIFAILLLSFFKGGQQ